MSPAAAICPWRRHSLRAILEVADGGLGVWDLHFAQVFRVDPVGQNVASHRVGDGHCGGGLVASPAIVGTSYFFLGIRTF